MFAASVFSAAVNSFEVVLVSFFPLHAATKIAKRKRMDSFSLVVVL